MRFHIENRTCDHCVKHVTEAITAIDSAAKVEADTTKRTIEVGTTASRKIVEQALETDGYPAAAI